MATFLQEAIKVLLCWFEEDEQEYLLLKDTTRRLNTSTLTLAELGLTVAAWQLQGDLQMSSMLLLAVCHRAKVYNYGKRGVIIKDGTLRVLLCWDLTIFVTHLLLLEKKHNIKIMLMAITTGCFLVIVFHYYGKLNKIWQLLTLLITKKSEIHSNPIDNHLEKLYFKLSFLKKD